MCTKFYTKSYFPEILFHFHNATLYERMSRLSCLMHHIYHSLYVFLYRICSHVAHWVATHQNQKNP